MSDSAVKNFTAVNIVFAKPECLFLAPVAVCSFSDEVKLQVRIGGGGQPCTN